MRSVVVDRAASASAALLAVACLALGLGACSLALPFQDRGTAAQPDADITGSIARRPSAEPAAAAPNQSPFSPRLDEEDWRRQRAAMATALDPQGSGGQVRWDNPDSGAKGAFSPIGDAFLARHEICRTFVASVAAQGPEEWFQGSACRVMAGEWRIDAVKPWKRPS